MRRPSPRQPRPPARFFVDYRQSERVKPRPGILSCAGARRRASSLNRRRQFKLQTPVASLPNDATRTTRQDARPSPGPCPTLERCSERLLGPQEPESVDDRPVDARVQLAAAEVVGEERSYE